MSRKLKWGVFGFIGLGALVLLAVLPGGDKQEFSVAEEFTLHPIVSLPSLGGVDLSVNKAVVYLWITTAVLVVLSIVVSRTIKKQPGRFQYTVEVLYELARDSIVGDVMKSGKATWFPYIGAVFFFVLASNLIGLLPLPLGENWQPSYYAATANLYVTLTLALFTFVFTHYAGIRKNGFRYFANWAPPSAPPVLKQLIWVIHLVSEVFRLVSLSVRLFANMLAGHAILGVFFAMALIFQNYLAALLLQGGSVLIYMFEIFVAFIQAFIFAILSAVYIGGALDQEH
jgi:F-type H+-transporting ATPase subunit a